MRKDATPSREPVQLALASLQKMLHRAGNVDGEGDGCGMLVDIPRRIWAEEVRAGGHNPALVNDPAFAVGHVFIERSRDVDRALHDARELLARAGLRILAERLGAVESQALGATAREEEPHFWQLAGLLAAPDDRDRALFALAAELESELGFHVPSMSATTCVYKVMGAPVSSAPTTPTSRTSGSRPPPALATTATPPTPGRRSGACSRSPSSATTVRSTRSSSSARRRGPSAWRSPPVARTRWTSIGRSST